MSRKTIVICLNLTSDLSYNNIYVWQVVLDHLELYAHLLQGTLSLEEQNKANHFYFDRDKLRFIIGRGILKMIMGRYLSIDPKKLIFSYTSSGKPFIAQPVSKPVLYFNVSHSNGRAIYGIALNREIGVDLEMIRPFSKSAQIVENFFSDQEKAELRQLPSNQQAVAFFSLWTRKEAYLKATGYGLSRRLDEFSVSLQSTESVGSRSIVQDSNMGSIWSVIGFIPADGYIAATVAEGVNWRLIVQNLIEG